MNILKQLSKEHDEVAALFKKLGKLTAKAVKQRALLFAELDLNLSAHTETEERILYSQMKSQVKDPDDVLEAFEEHKIAKELLLELRELDPSDETWGPKVTVLGEIIGHHVEEEEGDLFKEARKAFDSLELNDMGAEYVAKKESWMNEHADLGQAKAARLAVPKKRSARKHAAKHTANKHSSRSTLAARA